MANPRIIFNSKNADFTKKHAELLIMPMRSVIRNISASGVSETLNVSAGFNVRAKFINLSNSDATEGDLKTALYEAAMWAEAGETWVFSTDSAVTVNTTTDGAVALAATSIPVASATGVASGSRYALESATHVAIVEASNSATDPVGITVGVNAAFASGSRFRAFEYLPMIGSIQITEHTQGVYYDVEIVGSVDRRAL